MSSKNKYSIEQQIALDVVLNVQNYSIYRGIHA